MRGRVWLAAMIVAALACALSATSASARNAVSTVRYDSFDKPGGYTLADYLSKWNNSFGPGELAAGGTRDFSGGTLNVKATPFKTGADVGVFDHLKYIGISNRTFGVPADGSVTFSSDISAVTPGTVDGLVQHGVYGPSGSWLDPNLQPPSLAPYTANVLQGQQAGVVMNMIDFCTGQLFDWFVAGKTAFTLVERLPTDVTGNTSNPNCPDATFVGRSKMYTQIVDEIPSAPGVAHNVSITYTHKAHEGTVEFTFDGRKVSKVDHVGIPLDKQGGSYTGTYPSLGPGENLGDQIHSFAIGHGLFSLIDGFPFQHSDAPESSVSIPVGTSNPADAGRARLFGQGAIGTFDNFDVTTDDRSK
jgi:hypothetical protein